MVNIVRDPETGKFKNMDESVDVDSREVFTGRIRAQIAAADLTTGTDFVQIGGSDTEVIDFTPYLDSDEVFVVHRAEMTVVLDPARTATAEHVYNVRYALRGDVGDQPAEVPSQKTGSEGITALFQNDSDEDDVIFAGDITGGGDFADSPSGLAAGGFTEQADHVIQYPELGLPGPSFDEDDELGIPLTMNIKGSDDQAFAVEFAVVLVGQTYDL